MKTNSDFSDAKVGDLVTSLMYGHGVIDEVLNQSLYSIIVRFGEKDESEIDEYKQYDENGFYDRLHFAPTLFKGHISIESLQVTYNTLPNA